MVQPLQRAASAKRPVVLTQRDLALLGLVASSRAVPLDVLAPKFFGVDPVTGEQNADPSRACARRLQLLASAGYVWLTAFHDGAHRREVAMLGPRAEGVTATQPARNRIAPNKRAHHVRTLDALVRLEAHVRASGGRIVRTRFEHELRREQQQGRWTERGEKLGTFPDAAVTIEMADGQRLLVCELAVEYVTSKYSDDDIRGKHEAFGSQYAEVVWFADRGATARRVENITRKPCTTLS